MQLVSKDLEDNVSYELSQENLLGNPLDNSSGLKKLCSCAAKGFSVCVIVLHCS